MGHQFTIDDEAYALATELAALTGGSIDDAVTGALRLLVEQERDRRERATRLQDVLDLAREIRDMIGDDATLDTDFLYDQATGLPA